MIEALAQKLDPTQVAILIVALLYVTEKVGNFISHTIFKSKDKVDENTHAIRELIIKLDHTNTRLASMEITLGKLEEFKHVTWKLEKDVSYAFEKIRDLKDESRA